MIFETTIKFEAMKILLLYSIGLRFVYIMAILSTMLMILYIAKSIIKVILKKDKLKRLTIKGLLTIIVLTLIAAIIVPELNPQVQSKLYIVRSQGEYNIGNNYKSCRYLKISLEIEDSLEIRERICERKKLLINCDIDISCK